MIITLLYVSLVIGGIVFLADVFLVRNPEDTGEALLSMATVLLLCLMWIFVTGHVFEPWLT